MSRPALAELARDVVRHAGPEPFAPVLRAVPRNAVIPASFAQQRLWFLAQLFPTSVAYNEPIVVRMAGPVNAAALARSLAEITRRHESWRTVFGVVEGVPVQQIMPPGPFDLPVVDLTCLPVDQREPEAERRAVEHARLPFDLQRGPLVRALLLRVTETDVRLIVTSHHIVVDGVSFFNVFLPELHALYVAFSSGQPSPFPDLEIQVADFAAWQRLWLTEEALAPRLAYWRTHLAGMTELDLPADAPRKTPSDRGARARVALSAELMVKLRDIARRAGATLFTTLLAAWKTLLFRWSGQGDIVVGSAAAGRPRPELERLIGFFSNNLVLRTQLDGSLSFLELVPRVHEVVRAAREHQDVPFDRLIAELGVERSVNRHPLYNHVFILMPPLPPLNAPPAWSASRFDIGTAKVDLYLELHQRPSGLVGHIEYATDRYSAATVERLAGHLQTLLEGVARDPGQRLSDLPLLTAAERQALALWQGPALSPRPDSEISSLEQLFEAQAARSPSAIAVEHGGQRLTYRELNARANQLAHTLRSLGVGPGCLVGLCLRRSIDAVIGVLGVLKAGGAYVPLDPEYPAERLRFILEDADIQLLLTDARSAGAAQPRRGRVILLDKDWPAIAQSSAEDPEPLATAGDLAYVIYTSGSTGRPKGVLVERRGLYYLAEAQRPLLGLGVGSRVLQFFSLNFDGSVWDFAMTWPAGATLVLGDPQELLPGPNLARFLRDQEIHAVMVTPSALSVMPAEELPALRILICAGEALPAELVSRWARGRRFFNVYGPTETTVVSVVAECRPDEGNPPIGRPFAHVPAYILDDSMRPVPVGVRGELYLGGPGVARGYLARPELTEARFLDSPFPGTSGTRLYRTGDIARWRPDGNIDYLGRRDQQIKLRGFRVELGEIEAALGSHPDVSSAAVKLLEGALDKRLVAYVVPRAGAPEGLESALKAHLRARLPEYMVPARIVPLDRMPVNPSGKLDRDGLPRFPPLEHSPAEGAPRPAAPARGAAERAAGPAAPEQSAAERAARSTAPERSAVQRSASLERTVAEVWREVLGLDGVGVDAQFFEIGGHSLALARVQAKLHARLGVSIDMMTLLQLPTIRQIAAHLAGLPAIGDAPATGEIPAIERTAAFESAPAVERAPAGPAQADRSRPVEAWAPSPARRAGRDPAPARDAAQRAEEAAAPAPARPQDIAIVGLAIRAPGVGGPDDLWHVVLAGRDMICALDPEALIAAGADPERVRRPDFVAAEGVLEDADRFDAAFFGYSDADAALMDPQQRLFLECAYAALEHAGCDPARFRGRIGVFGGAGAPLYWSSVVADALRARGSDQERFRARTLNAPDFLATRVAFKLGLRGPALTVQTACSTSLTAVHLARQSLLTGECDLALAGGVALSTLSDAERGYLYAEGGTESADGRCRPFDAGASGMVKSSGVAIVVMKRLPSAVADRDTIHAILLGSAMNNDGAGKIGFTAPSEDGLADAIQRAYEAAGVDPGSVGFIEAHGTGTRLGDSIEVRALTSAFRRFTEQRGFCALGSVKANLGHMDSAASAAGLIKAVLALSHRIIPPVAGLRTPNPLLDLPSTPFFVNDAPVPWAAAGAMRRAGVNAMGIGGTNVHLVLEEAPPIEPFASARPFQLLCLSARTGAALAEVARRLGDHLAEHPSLDVADVAYTLAVGRAQLTHRATQVCQSTASARAALASGAALEGSAASSAAKRDRPVVFLFPGHGVQYVRMGLEVYETEPVVRAEVDRCVDLLRDVAGLDLRPLLLGQALAGERRLDEMQWAQPLLFTIEVALARQLLAWGVRPAAMLGHSVGEYVAACIAGVLSLRDALALVAARGRLMDSTPPGSMVTAFLDPREIEPYLGDDLAIATVAPGCVVLSGPVDAIRAARARLTDAGLTTNGVRVSRASHSPMMRPIRDELRRRVAEVERRPPQIPIVSNLTGTYLTPEQATSVDYWPEHLCGTVQLAGGLGTILDLESPVCIEVGPGGTLGSFLRAHPRYDSATTDVLRMLPGFDQRHESSCAALLRGLGRAWELGVEVDWDAFYAHEERRRVPLPTYPFNGPRYVLSAGSPAGAGDRAPHAQAASRASSGHGAQTAPRASSGHGAQTAPRASSGHGAQTAPDRPRGAPEGGEEPRVAAMAPGLGHASDAPDDAERLVRSVWTRLLGARAVLPEASFFELGGDSLLAVQLVSELRARTGRDIKMAQVIARPTIAGVAALLRSPEQPAPEPACSPANGEAATAPRESAVGGTAAQDATAAARESAAVRAFLLHYIERTQELSSAPLVERLWAQGEGCALTAIDGRAIVGRGPVEERLARGFAALRGARARLYDEHVLLFAGGRAACATALLDSDLALAQDGRPVSYRGVRVSFVLEKQGDGWRVIHAHYSVPMGAPDEIQR